MSIGTGLMHYLDRAVEAATRWAREAPDGDGPMIDDKAFLAGIGHILVEIEAGTCTPGPMGRVMGSDVARLACEELIDLIGPAATLPYGADGAIGNGAIEFAHRDAQHTATPGGTVEVFRTIIAQHDLGLPAPGLPRPQGVPAAGPPHCVITERSAGRGRSEVEPGPSPDTRFRFSPPTSIATSNYRRGPLRRSRRRSIVTEQAHASRD